MFHKQTEQNQYEFSMYLKRAGMVSRNVVQSSTEELARNYLIHCSFFSYRSRWGGYKTKTEDPKTKTPSKSS